MSSGTPDYIGDRNWLMQLNFRSDMVNSGFVNAGVLYSFWSKTGKGYLREATYSISLNTPTRSVYPVLWVYIDGVICYVLGTTWYDFTAEKAMFRPVTFHYTNNSMHLYSDFCLFYNTSIELKVAVYNCTKWSGSIRTAYAPLT